MSMFTCATIESRVTVGWSVNQAEPNNPASSPVCQTKMIERCGLTFAPISASATSSTVTVPVPSSSAPL